MELLQAHLLHDEDGEEVYAGVVHVGEVLDDAVHDLLASGVRHLPRLEIVEVAVAHVHVQAAQRVLVRFVVIVDAERHQKALLESCEVLKLQSFDVQGL